jgi:hypothetical protein
MNQNTEQDLKDLVHDFAQDVKDGIKIADDVMGIVTEHNIALILRFLTIDFPNGLADVCKTIADVIKTKFDILPSGKTKTTLSNGQVLEMKYYETHDTFQARIDKEEAAISKK